MVCALGIRFGVQLSALLHPDVWLDLDHSAIRDCIWMSGQIDTLQDHADLHQTVADDASLSICLTV